MPQDHDGKSSSKGGSILLSQRGPTGLSVKSCTAAPPDRSVSTHRRSGSPASAVGCVEPLSAAGAASASAPSEPRVVAADPVRLPPGRLVEVAPLAPLRLGVAKVTSTAGERDATPNARCGVRFSVQRMTVKPAEVFARSQGIAFIVITLNQVFNALCRLKSHSQCHCDTKTWSGGRMRRWMCCWKAVSTIIGTLIVAWIYWGLRPDHCGQKFNQKYQKQLNDKKTALGY